MTINSHLHSLGTYIPSTIISNDDIAAIVDTNNEWIVERTGIHYRRKLDKNENTSDLALKAALVAIKQADIDPSTLTHIIAATCTPDHLSPSVACIVAGSLNVGQVMAFDISAACAGFIYGLSLCNSILNTDPESNILFVCSEAMTRRLNWHDRSTCILFGDGASACVLNSSSSSSLCSLLDILCKSDGGQRSLITVGGGTACDYEMDQNVDKCFFLSMKGSETYRHAVRQMVAVCKEILERNNLTIDDIDLLVPHQANIRIIDAVGSRLNIPESKVFTNVAEYGNTSAASIPIALSEAIDKKYIKSGAKVLITAFGAGLTWGAAILQF